DGPGVAGTGCRDGRDPKSVDAGYRGPRLTVVVVRVESQVGDPHVGRAAAPDRVEPADARADRDRRPALPVEVLDVGRADRIDVVAARAPDRRVLVPGADRARAPVLPVEGGDQIAVAHREAVIRRVAPEPDGLAE